ncbi:hypothetical protein [Streptomyces sp. NPDC037389]|uniref:hypothetical protein n=1 Tax=Streptomyces sp. NPDC037389 TaxID=3155369 RepID=UPI0033F49463
MWPLINWNESSIKLRYVVIEEGNSYRSRKLTKDGEADAIIYVDQTLLNVLWWLHERQRYEKENPVEASANARHHSAGYTLTHYGRRRKEGAKKLAASSTSRIGLADPRVVGLMGHVTDPRVASLMEQTA